MIDQIHRPTIRSATVEIRTLTVGNKQVTQSLFRQLPEDRVIDYRTGELVGTPWGWVNYFWGRCRNNHLHVVWEDESHTLFRSCVWDHCGYIIPGTSAEAEYERSYLICYRSGQLYIAV